MANVIIIRPISESWSREIYKADDIGCKLSDIANNNLIKLENRKKNGTLHGSGDQRQLRIATIHHKPAEN